MHETLFRLRCLAGRFKFIFAVAGIFLSGTLLAMGYASWHYDAALTRQQKAYERQVSRLESDLTQERGINREKLEVLARDMDQISDALGRLLIVAERASQTANQAASTAKSAASTASSAAKNAAQANIKIADSAPEKPNGQIVEQSIVP